MVKHHIANANLMVSGVALGRCLCCRHTYARCGLQQWTTTWIGIPSSVELGWSEAVRQQEMMCILCVAISNVSQAR